MKLVCLNLVFLFFTVPAFSDLEHQETVHQSNTELLKEFYDLSLTPQQRLKAIQNLEKTDDIIIHQKLIEISLFDEDINVRRGAEEVLLNILDLSTKQKQVLLEFSDMLIYKSVRLFNHSLSSFTYLYIYFFLIKDEYKTKIKDTVFSAITKITESQQVFQNIMLKLLTYPTEDISKKAQEVLLNSGLSQQSQQKLLTISFSENDFSSVSKVMAQSILKSQALSLEIQTTLAQRVYETTLTEFSYVFTKTTAEYILTGTPYMDPVTQIALVKIATSEYSSDSASKTATNILIHAFANLDLAYKELIRLATSSESSDEVKINSKNILLKLNRIEKPLQQELLSIATSAKISPEAKKTAQEILINTKYIDPNVESGMSIFLRCRRAFSFSI